MIKLHHLERSRSHRIVWLLEELGVPYEIVEYKRHPETMLAPASLTKVHPLGKSPVISDDDVTVAESGAIIEYLAERYGKGALVPTSGTAEHQRCRYFMHYAEGTLMPPLLIKLIASKIRSAKVPFFVRPVTGKIASSLEDTISLPAITKHLAFLEAELNNRAWFCGADISIADFQMSYPLEALAICGAGPKTPNINRVLASMRERPSFKRAIERGGPIMID
jgi:glutathione S-transferase